MGPVFIYVVVRVFDGLAVYVGQTVNPTKRWAEHIRAAAKGSPYAFPELMRALGAGAFRVSVMPIMFETLQEANGAEQHMIRQLRTRVRFGGCNMTDGGQGWRGLSPDARARIGAANRRRVVSEETRRRVGEANKRRVVTSETKSKMSAAQKARIKSPRKPAEPRPCNAGYPGCLVSCVKNQPHCQQCSKVKSREYLQRADRKCSGRWVNCLKVCAVGATNCRPCSRCNYIAFVERKARASVQQALVF